MTRTDRRGGAVWPHRKKRLTEKVPSRCCHIVAQQTGPLTSSCACHPYLAGVTTGCLQRETPVTVSEGIGPDGSRLEVSVPRGHCHLSMSVASHHDTNEANAANRDETNHFIVDWDGPDDPSNPKKFGPVINHSPETEKVFP